jgi:hypothetical protein
VPLHVIQVFIFRLLSIPFLFDCVVSRLDAGPSNYVARTSQSYHGGEKGKYKLTCDKNGEGWAYLWAATSNATSLTTDDLDGAKELEEEDEDEEDEVLTDQLLDELDAVIVSGGKTVNEIKAMHVLEKKKHAEVCNKNRSISAQSVNELATKMGCPSDYTTKLSKLGWIFLQLQA